MRYYQIEAMVFTSIAWYVIGDVLSSHGALTVWTMLVFGCPAFVIVQLLIFLTVKRVDS